MQNVTILRNLVVAEKKQTKEVKFKTAEVWVVLNFDHWIGFGYQPVTNHLQSFWREIARLSGWVCLMVNSCVISVYKRRDFALPVSSDSTLLNSYNA